MPVMLMFVSCLALHFFVVKADNMTMSVLLKNLFRNYDKALPPTFDLPLDARQVELAVNVYIKNMYSVSAVNMEYSISMFLRKSWMDKRLAYNDVLNWTRLELDQSLFGTIWQPDVYISTEKQSDFHYVTVPNQYIHIYPDGKVQYSTRTTGSFFCAMDLRKYPFDSQECKLEFESYGFDNTKMKLVWDTKPVLIAKQMKYPQFHITAKDPYYCDKTYFDITYPCIGVKFVLQRDNSQSLIQIYVPTALIVILSWVSFWIDCTSVPGRVSLALLTVLTMTTQSAGAVANLPAVSYIKAIDVWLSVCLTFVFLGLIEFAYVNVQYRVDYRRRQCKSVDRLIKSPGSSRLTDLSTITINGRQQLHGEGIDENMCNNGHENHAEQSCWPCFKHLARLERARAIDKASRVIFPAACIVFNVIYWTYVFHWAPGFMEGWD